MKPFKKSFLSAFFLLLSSPAVLALSIVAKEEPPYFGNKLPEQGLSAEIITTVLDRAGYKSSLAFETWPRAYEGALIGVYDAVGSIWLTEERAKDFAFSEPYLFHEIKFIKKKSSKGIKFGSLEDLDGLVIGTIKGYAYGDPFLQSRTFIRLPQNHLLQNLHMLTQDKIDLTLGDVRKIQFEANKYMKGSIKDLTFLPKPLIRRGTHIAVSKINPEHKEIISRFNKALAEMKEDGSYDQIIKKHGY